MTYNPLITSAIPVEKPAVYSLSLSLCGMLLMVHGSLLKGIGTSIFQIASLELQPLHHSSLANMQLCKKLQSFAERCY